jgi:hypothetical protein
MDIRRASLTLLATTLVTMLGVSAVDAAKPVKRSSKPFGVARPTRAQTLDVDRRIDVNTINMWASNNGSFAFDQVNGNTGLYWPRGTDKGAIFAAGLWLGATVGGDVRTVVAEYSMEYGPGRINVGGMPDDPTRPEYVTYKMVRWTGNPSDSARVERVPNEAAYEDDIVHHSWSEYVAGAKPYGAPTRMYRLPDTSTPAEDDSVEVEGPDVLGDMMLWTVYNDADPSIHENDAGGSEPLGIEIQQTTFAFNRQGALGNTVFIKYTLINKGSNTLEDMYLSQWSDPDLGGGAGFTDDLVGCDTLPDNTGKPRSLGFVYNSNNNDGGYGARPPALGFDFFKGPVGENGDTLGLTSFNKYINGTDPASTDETYNYMQGLQPDGSPTLDPFGNETRFSVAGDPVSPGPTSWLDTNPADRRMMLSSGPFTMAPGDTQTVVVGIVIGQGNDRLSSISALRFNDEFAQDAFDKDFDLPSPPPQPIVAASVDHQEVTLSWDTASRTNYTEEGYAFEGYNVYQGASVAGPWKLVATYDEVNGTRFIYDQVFDPNTGQLIPAFPVAFGSDLGVRYEHTITQDAVLGGTIKDGKEYYFAVTAYAYNADGVPKVLENAQNVVRVTPQRPAAGTDLATASATEVTYLRKDESKAPATDVVTVEVVNPELVTGHTYKVVFEELTPPYQGPLGALEDVTVLHSWSLVDSTTGEVKYTGQLNRNGDDDYLVVDGIRVRVNGKYSAQFQDAAYLNLNTENRRALTGANFGQAAFGGGAGSGWDFFGGTIDPATDPDSFTTVRLRFSSTATQKAYRFFRKELYPDGGAAPGAGRGYDYAGFHECNFQAWDEINEVQLDVIFVERALADDDGTLRPLADQAAIATHDSTWAPTDAEDGDREYLMVLRRPYSDTPKPEIARNGAPVDDSLPLMWALTAHLRTPDDVIDDGDAFEWTWANPAKDNDVYVFSTTALQRSNAALAKGGLDRVRAVPNPYYARSSYELNQFNRIVRFMNLPETCTIRIFNLAGQLVRTLEKTDATTSILNWDLQTRNDLPVGSGVYIFHVDAPGVGATTGRLVIFMEKERLNSF